MKAVIRFKDGSQKQITCDDIYENDRMFFYAYTNNKGEYLKSHAISFDKIDEVDVDWERDESH